MDQRCSLYGHSCINTVCRVKYIYWALRAIMTRSKYSNNAISFWTQPLQNHLELHSSRQLNLVFHASPRMWVALARLCLDTSCTQLILNLTSLSRLLKRWCIPSHPSNHRLNTSWGIWNKIVQKEWLRSTQRYWPNSQPHDGSFFFHSFALGPYLFCYWHLLSSCNCLCVGF